MFILHYSPSQFGPDTSQELKNPMWLVDNLLDGKDLEYQLFSSIRPEVQEVPAKGIQCPQDWHTLPLQRYLFIIFSSFLFLSLESPLECVFHGKERVISVGVLTIVNIIIWGSHCYVPIKHAVHLLTSLPFIFSINPAQGY